MGLAAVALGGELASAAVGAAGPTLGFSLYGMKTLPIDQALNRMYQRTPIQEVNFFNIVLAIQQKAGGNLSEALATFPTCFVLASCCARRSRRCHRKRKPRR